MLILPERVFDTDVIRLADVSFHSFRTTCAQYYTVRLANHLTSMDISVS